MIYRFTSQVGKKYHKTSDCYVPRCFAASVFSWLTAIAGLILLSFTIHKDFLTQQKKFQRVREAITLKGETVTNKLTENGITEDNLQILIVVYKDSDQLILYGKSKQSKAYQELETYKICARSGQLGPKRRQGDFQVPEGFYHIDRFNPTSRYHLSLGINYPNQADRIKTSASDPGDNIFIHGACSTIGCLPMTNDKIQEIYLYALHARNNGQTRIPVYIFPFRMDNNTFAEYKEFYRENTALIEFWNNLKTGYDLFVASKEELMVVVDRNGDYGFRGK